MIEEDQGIDIAVDAFPTGYAFINVIRGASFKVLQHGVALETCSYLAGPGTTHFSLKMTHIQRALTIQLQPFALPFIFNRPAHCFAHEQLSLKDVNPEIAERLEALVQGDTNTHMVLRACEEVILNYCTQTLIDPRAHHGLEQILGQGGQQPIKSLSADLNLSQRRLQQLFSHYFGLSPKALSRIVKMQYHSFQLLNGLSMEQIIPDGYFDQSHFIHELKKQTGRLPGEYEAYISAPERKVAYYTSNLYFKSESLR
ncbi:MAG: hypothetical protein Roseis2KO_22820 [Roseivirga sp.]